MSSSLDRRNFLKHALFSAGSMGCGTHLPAGTAKAARPRGKIIILESKKYPYKIVINGVSPGFSTVPPVSSHIYHLSTNSASQNSLNGNSQGNR